MGFSLAFYYFQSFAQADALQKDAFNTINELTDKLKDVATTPRVLVKYRNGTEDWYNQTHIPIGWSLFNATLKITDGDVDYQQYPFGVFITAINGVAQEATTFWLWYQWNATSNGWEFGPVGADAYRVRSGDVLAWYLTDGSTTP
jgi:hypothetical protein